MGRPFAHEAGGLKHGEAKREQGFLGREGGRVAGWLQGDFRAPGGFGVQTGPNGGGPFAAGGVEEGGGEEEPLRIVERERAEEEAIVPEAGEEAFGGLAGAGGILGGGERAEGLISQSHRQGPPAGKLKGRDGKGFLFSK